LKTHHSPLPGAPNVEGFRVARTRVPHEGPKGIDAGAERVKSRE
jgi:hypothetical protein